MTKVKREIITIDAEKCDGCGNCVPSCAEGALQIVDGKARLVKESYCDGLGACLGECPQGALTVVEVEADPFDEAEVTAHLGHKPLARPVHVQVQELTSTAMRPIPLAAFPACPSVQPRQIVRDEPPANNQPRLKSELRQWPVQLHLVPMQAPFYQGADLTLIADCVPFANPNMHADLMAQSVIAVGCPKLDDGNAYIRKLAQILASNDVRSLKVAYMEVPCCRGLVFIAEQALKASGKDIPLEITMVSIQAT
jgi:Pyruvate/2-oxoacid:ferredoxin oxidoreductase delta subunit